MGSSALPEALIDSDPVRYVRSVMGKRHAGLAAFAPEALAEYERCVQLPGSAQAICEDYRAIKCPVYAVGGWQDGYSNAIFRLLKNLKVPRKGLVGPWAHAAKRRSPTHTHLTPPSPMSPTPPRNSWTTRR